MDQKDGRTTPSSAMTNREKLDLVVRMQRRARTRRILWGVAVLLLTGAVLVYAQFRHAVDAGAGL